MSAMQASGPLSSKSLAKFQQPARTACFSVHAAAEPAVMPRVMAVFVKRGLVPSQWHSTVCGLRDEELQIDLQVKDLAPATLELVAAALRQIVGVECVLTFEKQGFGT